ncbi:MAG: aminotransferase class I/II-fold pyridoxal phosphate-dependent enzyme [Alphaproteobacteria bacterium]|nr:aminotransferase class I/II-fold pyridoxal phosphate-dependent enzyme [Alphaproteobacteria bacterium]
MPLNPQLDSLSDYPFEALRTLLAPVTPATNAVPIVLSVGEPQHQPPALLTETLAAHAQEWNRYPAMAGTPELRTAIADWLTRRYRLSQGSISADQNVLTLAGTKEGLYLLAGLVVPRAKGGLRPVVLCPNPYYLVYNGAATMAGAEAVFLDATRENAFLPDLAAIPTTTLERTALMYLCSPANPQGTIAGLDYLQQAIALARRYDFVLAVDECYAEIYDKEPAPGALEACAPLGGGFDRVLVFHSLSKRSSAAGLRSGFVAGDPELIARFSHLRSYGGCQVPLPIQAAATALWRDETHVVENRDRYRRKFDIAQRLIGDRYGFYRPQGGFFLWLDVGDGEAATISLWRDAAVRVLPGGYTARAANGRANPGSRYIRLALVHEEEVLEDAFARIRQVL